MTTSDHFMVGITSCMLFICYKIGMAHPFTAGFLIWMNLHFFDRYCLRRKNAGK